MHGIFETSLYNKSYPLRRLACFFQRLAALHAVLSQELQIEPLLVSVKVLVLILTHIIFSSVSQFPSQCLATRPRISLSEPCPYVHRVHGPTDRLSSAATRAYGRLDLSRHCGILDGVEHQRQVLDIAIPPFSTLSSACLASLAVLMPRSERLARLWIARFRLFLFVVLDFLHPLLLSVLIIVNLLCYFDFYVILLLF